MKDANKMKRGKKRDEIGRLDHTKSCDERRKSNDDWLHEYEADIEDNENGLYDHIFVDKQGEER